jgi:hypothetical protein
MRPGPSATQSVVMRTKRNMRRAGRLRVGGVAVAGVLAPLGSLLFLLLEPLLVLRCLLLR